MDPWASWGRFPRVQQSVSSAHWQDDVYSLLRKSESSKLSVLPRGLGRSYGDSCLNADQLLLSTRSLDRFIHFDHATGVLRCEAGVSLAEILELVVPCGWFLPVTPGTKFVTVAGAIANDIHGKNHHAGGNWGNHVRKFELLRSNGTRHVCSPSENSDWFAATIGGLGLTGVILWAEIQLKPIRNSAIAQETIRFRNIDEFFEISEESERDYEYTVSWVDCLAKGKNLGRGIFIRGNHAPSSLEAQDVQAPKRALKIPVDFPNLALNPLSIRAFNELYYHKHPAGKRQSIIHFEPFFYPLDSVLEWNRIYGKRGFLQYQFVVPYKSDGGRAARAILEKLVDLGLGSFLAVMKTFGEVPALGMLSFPRPGITVALDFPNEGERLFSKLEAIDHMVLEAGGAIYPAKDSRMSPRTFTASFPKLKDFKAFVDPRFSSSFWRRVTES